MPKYVVRYGSMRLLGVHSSNPKQQYSRGTRVIVRTDRGLEAGEVLCEADEPTIGKLKDPTGGQILRAMTANDANELSRIGEESRQKLEVCQKFIDTLSLPMNLVDVEHLFGGERIVVYYLADGRVDFRELVRRLAGEFQTRIEMRQIGVRDEAKLMADYGDCGNSVCCNSHLSEMPPVSMKMAKLQKATLDPSKISGRCGRLKCCLRYEYDVYEQIQKELPRIGSRVTTPDGQGRVINHEILTGQVLVESDDRHRRLVALGDLSPPDPDGSPAKDTDSQRPVPSKPAPSKPAPSKPAPSKQAPSKQAPSKQAPSKRAPSKRAPPKPPRSRE